MDLRFCFLRISISKFKMMFIISSLLSSYGHLRPGLESLTDNKISLDEASAAVSCLVCRFNPF